jgi:hypothetical protein
VRTSSTTLASGIFDPRLNSAAPTLFGLALYGRRFRVFDLDPMRWAPGTIGRGDSTLARFHKRHNLDITASLIALHGVGVGGYDRVRRRDVYHCEAARL